MTAGATDQGSDHCQCLGRAVQAVCELNGALLEAAKRVHGAAGRLYLTGGAIRDIYFQREPADFDLAADLPMTALARLFPQHTPWGQRFRSLRVGVLGMQFELTSLRKRGATGGEFAYLAGGDDFSSRTVDEDARLRDLTIHAIYFDLASARLVDPCGGVSDLIARRVVFVDSPQRSLTHDPLRALRALRIAARHSLHIDGNLLDPIQSALKHLGSDARTHYELYKALSSGSCEAFLQLLMSADLTDGFIATRWPDAAAAREALLAGARMLDRSETKPLNLEGALATLLLPLIARKLAGTRSASPAAAAQATCKALATSAFPNVLTFDQRASLVSRWMNWHQARRAANALL